MKRWPLFLFAMMAAGPPKVEAQLLEVTVQRDANSYRAFVNSILALDSATDGLETVLVANRAAMVEFGKLSAENTRLVDELYDKAPKLRDKSRLLVQAGEATLQESKALYCEAQQLTQMAYEVLQIACQVHAAAAALPDQLRALNTAIEIGKILTAGLWFGIGHAVGAASAATTTSTTTVDGGFIGGGGKSPWGMIGKSPWGGGGGGFGSIGWFSISKSVATTAGSSFSALSLLPLAGLAGVGMGQSGGQSCYGGYCPPTTAECQTCVEEATACNGSVECINAVRQKCEGACVEADGSTPMATEPCDTCDEPELLDVPATPVPDSLLYEGGTR